MVITLALHAIGRGLVGMTTRFRTPPRVNFCFCSPYKPSSQFNPAKLRMMRLCVRETDRSDAEASRAAVESVSVTRDCKAGEEAVFCAASSSRLGSGVRGAGCAAKAANAASPSA